MRGNAKILLVIGPNIKSSEQLRNALSRSKKIVSNAKPYPSVCVLAFCDERKNFIEDEVRRIFGERCETINSSEVFEKVDLQVRESLRSFGADLRLKLCRIASKVGGKDWKVRFNYLWWLTEVSTKNNPGEGYWWNFFRVGAVKVLLGEEKYQGLVVVGEKSLVDLGKQLSREFGLRFYGYCNSFASTGVVRLLAARFRGFSTLVIAILLARWKASRFAPHQNAIGRGSGRTDLAIFTWYPRVWTRRFGVWQDMYYGGMAEIVERRFGLQPTWILRMYDRTKFVSPKVYWNRLKALEDPRRKASDQAVILETFGSLKNVVKIYLDFGDIFRFSRMARHQDFSPAFEWEGLNVSQMLIENIWRSAFVSWPHLELLSNRVKRATEALNPKAAILYCFEFVYGRAIIDGTRKGAPEARVMGLQHGPISPMKLLYAAAPKDHECLNSGAEPVPSPDLYFLDGKIASQIMKEECISADTIYAVGSARFDSVWERANQGHIEKDEEDKFQVLIAPGLHDTRFVLRLALNGLQGDDRLKLLIKPHPKVSTDFVMQLIETLDNYRSSRGKAEIHVVKDGDIYQWMERSDVFLATYSSTGVEAIAFGVPVILLVPKSTPDMSLFHGHEVNVLTAYSAHALRQLVDRLLEDPVQRASYVRTLRTILHDSFGETDSRASERLALQVARMCGKNGL